MFTKVCINRYLLNVSTMLKNHMFINYSFINTVVEIFFPVKNYVIFGKARLDVLIIE